MACEIICRSKYLEIYWNNIEISWIKYAKLHLRNLVSTNSAHLSGVISVSWKKYKKELCILQKWFNPNIYDEFIAKCNDLTLYLPRLQYMVTAFLWEWMPGNASYLEDACIHCHAHSPQYKAQMVHHYILVVNEW